MRVGDECSPRGQEDRFPGEGGLASVPDLLPLASLVLAADGSAAAVNQQWVLLSAVPAGGRARVWLARRGRARGIESRCGACSRGRSPPVNRAAENSVWPVPAAVGKACGGGGRARQASCWCAWLILISTGPGTAGRGHGRWLARRSARARRPAQAVPPLAAPDSAAAGQDEPGGRRRPHGPSPVRHRARARVRLRPGGRAGGSSAPACCRRTRRGHPCCPHGGVRVRNAWQQAQVTPGSRSISGSAAAGVPEQCPDARLAVCLQARPMVAMR